MEDRVVVQDANVLMDLVNGGILDAWFRLGIETWTTDFVLAEIKDPKQETTVTKAMGKRQLLVAESATESYGQISGFHTTWGISIADASVLHTAKAMEVPLMSGDATLRKAASREGVQVIGVLWALDELVDNVKISAGEAAWALVQILEAGSYLPKAECEKRIKIWVS